MRVAKSQEPTDVWNETKRNIAVRLFIMATVIYRKDRLSDYSVIACLIY